WDTTKAGLHAFDFLKSYNFDWTSNNPSGIEQTQFANPLIGTSLASLPTQPSISNPYAGGTTFGIALDPNLPSGHNNLQGEASNQLFAIWGATITTVTTPSISSGTYAGDSNTSLTVTFTTGSGPSFDGTVVLAWADHVAAEFNWGPNSGAASISGSPYHQAISPASSNLNFGSQDHQIA